MTTDSKSAAARGAGRVELDARVEDTLGKMSLEQKCALLSGATAFGTRAYPALGVPALEFSDGPHGVRHQSSGANHLGIGGSDPATCFPTAVTVANTWDPDLASRMGAALGEEARTMGVNVLLGPGLCLKRSPLCGRDFEYFSEDPYLAGKMAAGFVRGVQSQGVAACPKHFAANSQETRRQASDSVVDERTLRELYLTGFEHVVREAHPQAIMSSYNLVNGTYANENDHLLTQVLRNEWGFDGAVVTDWGGSVDHVAGVRAGSTFQMPAPGMDDPRALCEAVRAGRLAESVVDDRVREALRLVFATDPAVRTAPAAFDQDAHHELARTVAAEGLVLLKNAAPAGAAGVGAGAADAAPVLPLAAHTRVALVGDFARVPRYQGAGSSLVNCTRLDTLLDVAQASDDLDLVGYESGFARSGEKSAAKLAAAVELVRGADVAVVCLGLGEVEETEGADRRTMDLAPNQVELLHAVREACGRVVVLLSGGAPVSTGWAADCDALLYLALGGQAGARAAYDALCGRVNPSGHLAETWARSLADTPCARTFPSDEATAEYREGLYVGYRYYQTAGVPVAFPFGFGLSYTRFDYADAAPKLTAAGELCGVSLTVENVGNVAGATVAQLYVAKPDHVVFRPEQELKGFCRVELAPGEKRRVTIELDDTAFRYYNVRTGSWEVEGGTYELRIGDSCDDIRLTLLTTVAGTGAPDPYEGLGVDSYRTGRVADVPDAEFAALLGHAIPSPRVTIGRDMCFRDLGHSRSPILWVVYAVLSALHRRNYSGSGAPNLNVEFVYNMPLHAIATMTPAVSMGVVDALVREARGWGLLGVVPALLVRLLTGGWFAAVWALWVLVPIAAAFVLGLARDAAFGRRLG
ncbi:glycoside hydrolase family 3 C-terminal domain-containing protein [Parafannyhessea umbonata]|uniref:glycoside hydrolase family 3 C-terminal domain-containing protein n=2 Tax=Parafannyhessea umbonata TaxID=604330 RepID=UPI002A83B9E7|nr:glycoside hydrolase family 3 N-terminal domain-containing protein [Parafannyhessea umbonata]MDY4015059.1 glycoside hydrolase family 3 C-terminal domain-containing protein [Parafannyhessea umbonata]